MLKSKSQRPCPCGSGRKLKACCRTEDIAKAVADGKRLADQRLCGDCQACCELIGVKEFGKPYAHKCQHQCSLGCGIYAQRPASCRDYNCIWKFTETLPDEARPDLCGVLLHFDCIVNNRKTLLVMETRPNAIEMLSPAVAQWIDDYGQQSGNQVLLVHHGERLGTNYPIAPEYPQGSYNANQRAGKLSNFANFYVLEPQP